MSLPRRPPRRLLRLVLALVGAYLAYVIAVNGAARTDAVRRAVNKHPDKTFITWRSLTSWFPGQFQVRGFEIIGQGSRDIYYARLDEGSFRVQLLPLLRREIRTAELAGRGVDFRLRRETNVPPDELVFQPPIPGLDALPRRTAPRRPKGPPGAWRLHVDAVRLAEVEQLWIYNSRLLGPGALEGQVAMQFNGVFRSVVERFELPAAAFVRGPSLIGTNLAFRVAGELGPLTFGVDDVPGDRIWEFIQVRAGLRGELGSLEILGDRFGRERAVEFGGGGRIDADLQVAAGEVQAGSRLEIRSPALRGELGRPAFTGDAQVRDEVTADGGTNLARLRVSLANVQARRGGELISEAPGPEIVLESVARELRLGGRFEDATLRFSLAPAVVPDASFLNEFLPPGAGLRLTGGRLRLQADFASDAARRGAGRIELSGEGLAAEVDGQPHALSLALAAPFEVPDIRGDIIRSFGTSLVITNIQVPGLRPEQEEGWFARFDIAGGEIERGEPLKVRADVRVALRDTRPLVAVLRADEDAPSWLRLLPTVRDLAGGGVVEIRGDETHLRAVQLEGDRTDIRAELALGTNGTRGIFYAQRGGVAAGFDLRGERRSWRLFGARRWYERALASPLAPPAVPEPEEADGTEPEPRPRRR
ncbi:MAG TPA: hypothetical protein PKE47_03755 [Verrucomicrobiota bacterium]|nr:hypothetical protein [Verrucomicrobiota bacterium]